jgi:GT2 family glycosyltransferase
MDKPLVSIVVPLFNKARHVEQCLRSLAEQTLEQIEVIIIDDGSTDGSGAIARAFSETDDRFTYHHQENAGVSAAMNRGLALARGAFFARVDGDDWVEPNMYEKLYHIATGARVPHVRCGFFRAYAQGGSVEIPVTASRVQRRGSWCFERLFGEVDVAFMSTCYGIYATETLREADLSFPVELTNLEDLFFNARFFALDTPVVLLPSSLYHYRQDPDSLSQKPRLGLAEQLGIFEELMQEQVLGAAPSLGPAYARYRSVALLTTAADLSRFGAAGMRALSESGMYQSYFDEPTPTEYPSSLRPLRAMLNEGHFGSAAIYARALRFARGVRRVLMS